MLHILQHQTYEPAIGTKRTAFNKSYGTTTTDVKMNGTQAVGSVDAIARIDHVHPVDTSRQATITGGASTITSSNLTASMALVSDANGKVAASSISTTKLGYLTDVTSNIQSQLNGKANLTGANFTGNVTASAGLNIGTTIPSKGDGSILWDRYKNTKSSGWSIWILCQLGKTKSILLPNSK